jgi:hypothetical protein
VPPGKLLLESPCGPRCSAEHSLRTTALHKSWLSCSKSSVHCVTIFLLVTLYLRCPAPWNPFELCALRLQSHWTLTHGPAETNSSWELFSCSRELPAFRYGSRRFSTMFTGPYPQSSESSLYLHTLFRLRSTGVRFPLRPDRLWGSFPGDKVVDTWS